MRPDLSGLYFKVVLAMERLHFNVNYNYDDVLDCQYTSGQRQIIWKYEVVGIEPILEEHKQLIEKYLANKS